MYLPGWVAILTIRAPERVANSLSLNCWEIVHGIMSPNNEGERRCERRCERGKEVEEEIHK